MLTATERDVLAAARDRLMAAQRGERRRIVDEAARVLGRSYQTVYRQLNEAGFDSGRKRRSDAGDCMLDTEQLHLVAGVLQTSLNKKGQRMPVGTALDMLRASGALGHDVSESTVNRQLHARRLHPDQMALPEPSVQMRSKHPNHVWQIDSTTGAYYYLPGGRLRWMDETEFYKNKVSNLVKAASDLLTRYAAADHTSHAFKVRYYLGGETAENLLDFASWAMWKQDHSPMHGVPLILAMDPGAANKGTLMRNYCKRLGIEPIWHAPRAARVTGSVEKAHDLARMHFETRLRFVNPHDVSLDWLNERIARWAAAFCAERVHSRHGCTRFGKWLEIKAEQLRVAASLDALREAAVREPETRRVSNDKTITFGSRDRIYDLALVPGVVAGLRVTVAQNPFRAPAIDVLFTDADTGAETWHVVQPVALDEHGYRADGPVWGEDMRTAAHSEVDKARAAMNREAYRTGDGLPTLEEAATARRQHAQAFAGVVDAMADVDATQVPTYLPKRATPINLPQRQVQARLFTVAEAAIALKARLGTAYQPQVWADLSAEFAGGVPEDRMDELYARYAPAAPAAEADHALRLIGGGAA
jgi:hypothetical protein